MEARQNTRAVNRLAFFSDAVFAVVLVMLTSHILVPETYVKSDVLHDAIGDASPQLFGAAVAFMVIATLWVEHHRLFDHLRHLDEPFYWGNLGFLGAIVLLSFPAAVFIKHLNAPVAIYFFAGATAVSGLIWAALWWYASGPGRPAAEIDRASRLYVMRRSLAMPVVLVLTAPAAAATFTVGSDHVSLAIALWVAFVPAARFALARQHHRSDPAIRGQG